MLRRSSGFGWAACYGLGILGAAPPPDPRVGAVLVVGVVAVAALLFGVARIVRPLVQHLRGLWGMEC